MSKRKRKKSGIDHCGIGMWRTQRHDAAQSTQCIRKQISTVHNFSAGMYNLKPITQRTQEIMHSSKNTWWHNNRFLKRTLQYRSRGTASVYMHYGSVRDWELWMWRVQSQIKSIVSPAWGSALLVKNWISNQPFHWIWPTCRTFLLLCVNR